MSALGGSAPRRQSWLALIATLVVAVPALVWAANWAAVHRPISAAWSDDSRNDGIGMWTHYAWWVKPGSLVLDIRDVSLSKAPVDVMRMVFQAAEAMKDRSFDTVELSYRGETRFLLDGGDFQTLGRQMAYGENPVYMLRTFPEKLRDAKGRSAFGEWTGGVLGVMKEQMEDLTELHKQWYLNDEIARAD